MKFHENIHIDSQKSKFNTDTTHIVKKLILSN